MCGLTHAHSPPPPQAQVQVLERQLHEANREREGLEVRPWAAGVQGPTMWCLPQLRVTYG